MQARTNEPERRLIEQERSAKNIRFEQEQEQRFIMQAIALARKAEKMSSTRRTNSRDSHQEKIRNLLRVYLSWILWKAKIDKHCVASMSRGDNYKDETTTMTINFRDIGTKKKINTWPAKSKGSTYQDKFGHTWDGNYIRGEWTTMHITKEMNVMLSSIRNCMKFHLGVEAMRDRQIGA